MEILQLIIDYDMDYSLQICNRTFKQFGMPVLKQ